MRATAARPTRGILYRGSGPGEPSLRRSPAYKPRALSGDSRTERGNDATGAGIPCPRDVDARSRASRPTVGPACIEC